jgi:endoglucanase
VEDEFFWAAAELYITTGSDVYRDYLMASSYLSTARSAVPDATSSAMYWGDTEALGALSLLSAPNGLPQTALDKLRGDVITTADRYLSIIDAEGYRVPFGLDGYVWGSNSGVLNNAIILAVAHDLTDDARYLNGILDSMNYVLGMNANDLSFVSGFGARAMEHPHHRFWANQPENGYPAPPPGVIAGGPNSAPADPAAIAAVSDVPTSRRYIDHIDSYSTNEVAINWNAPLVWVAAYLTAR